MKERVAFKKVDIPYDISEVYSLIIKNEAHWRSDLKEVIIKDTNNWIEIDTYGNETKFRVLEKTQDESYQFAIYNKRFDGLWSSTFKKINDQQCRLELSEKLQIKNPLMYYISLVFWNLDKIQQAYIDDLLKELNRLKGSSE